MASPYPLTIDVSEAHLDLERDQLEALLLTLADEMMAGDLVESAELVRETASPETAKSGVTAFLTGLLMAEVSRENLGKLLRFLGHRFYGKTLVLSGEFEGMAYNIEYRNAEELEQAIAGVERLGNLHLQISEQRP